MRILLDEQLSPSRVGDAIAGRGHDVRCVAREPALAGLTDEEVLAVAAAEGRVLVTRNARDFVPIARDWADAGRRHAGLLVIWSRETDEFGSLVDGIVEALAAVGDHESWIDLTRSL
jgi:predicted nuclease of predicted toxin-antitoxin system